MVLSGYIYRGTLPQPLSTIQRNTYAFKDKVAAWNFADIEKDIDKLSDKVIGHDRNGLKAIANPGGFSGMQSFERSKGQ